MAGIENQLRLTALLKYLHHGDFSVFRRAAEISGFCASTDSRFAVADLLLACQRAGFIEVGFSGGERTWWSAFEDAVFVRSPVPKLIPVRAATLLKPGAETLPLVTARDNEDLIWGVLTSEPLVDACDLAPSFLSRLPIISDIERQTCRTEHTPPDLSRATVERFCPDRARWEPISPAELPIRSLLRIRPKFGTWLHLIPISESGPLIVLANNEWAMPVARNILSWPLDPLVRSDGGSLLVSRAFRLPGLLLRFLFANASHVSIGGQIRAYGMNPVAQRQILKYLKAT